MVQFSKNQRNYDEAMCIPDTDLSLGCFIR